MIKIAITNRFSVLSQIYFERNTAILCGQMIYLAINWNKNFNSFLIDKSLWFKRTNTMKQNTSCVVITIQWTNQLKSFHFIFFENGKGGEWIKITNWTTHTRYLSIKTFICYCTIGIHIFLNSISNVQNVFSLLFIECD